MGAVKSLKKKKSEWQLQEAKNSLSEVVNRALTEGAQTITRHGKPVAVVVSKEEFVCGAERGVKESLHDIMRSCPAPGLPVAKRGSSRKRPSFP